MAENSHPAKYHHSWPDAAALGRHIAAFALTQDVRGVGGQRNGVQAAEDADFCSGFERQAGAGADKLLSANVLHVGFVRRNMRTVG